MSLIKKIKKFQKNEKFKILRKQKIKMSLTKL